MREFIFTILLPLWFSFLLLLFLFVFVFVCIRQWLLGTVPTLKWGRHTQWHSTDENGFSLCSGYQFQIASWLGVESPEYFPSQYWGPVWLHPVQAVHVLPQSPRVHVRISPVESGRHHFLRSLALIIFLSFHMLPESWGEDSNEDFPFRTGCSKVSCTLPSCGFVHRSLHTARSLLLWWELS